MSLPNGSQQALSLAWALREVADFEAEHAVEAACRVFGMPRDEWAACVTDPSWFVGERWNGRENIESLWNSQFARLTDRWLDEDAWHAPLWQLWLVNPKMVLAANLDYLIKARGRGTVEELAKATDKNRSTVSKWGRWRVEGEDVRGPPSTSHPKILEFFGLKPSLDLTMAPLFLGLSEAKDDILRNQGRHYLDCLSGEHLEQAIERLREESARYAVKRLQKVSSNL